MPRWLYWGDISSDAQLHVVIAGCSWLDFILCGIIVQEYCLIFVSNKLEYGSAAN